MSFGTLALCLQSAVFVITVACCGTLSSAAEASGDTTEKDEFVVELLVASEIRQIYVAKVSAITKAVFPDVDTKKLTAELTAVGKESPAAIKIYQNSGAFWVFDVPALGMKGNCSFPDLSRTELLFAGAPPDAKMVGKREALTEDKAIVLANTIRDNLGPVFPGGVEWNRTTTRDVNVDFEDGYRCMIREKPAGEIVRIGQAVEINLRKKDGMCTSIICKMAGESALVNMKTIVAVASKSVDGFQADRMKLSILHHWTNSALVWHFEIPAAPMGGPQHITKWSASDGRLLYSEVLNGGSAQKPYREKEFFPPVSQKWIESELQRQVEKRCAELSGGELAPRPGSSGGVAAPRTGSGAVGPEDGRK